MFASFKNAHRYGGKARPPPPAASCLRRGWGESLCLIAKLSVNKISDLQVMTTSEGESLGYGFVLMENKERKRKQCLDKQQ
jgi:hypothetical protein